MIYPAMKPTTAFQRTESALSIIFGIKYFPANLTRLFYGVGSTSIVTRLSTPVDPCAFIGAKVIDVGYLPNPEFFPTNATGSRHAIFTVATVAK